VLVTPQYVADSTGADISDEVRVLFLIEEASELVLDHLRRTFTAGDAPVAVRQAVAILVASALSESATDEVKSEAVGDYRVEYATAGRYAAGLDIRRVEHLLRSYVTGTRSVRTDVAFDGVVDYDPAIL
jgi:hypothetical protein